MTDETTRQNDEHSQDPAEGADTTTPQQDQPRQHTEDPAEGTDDAATTG
jgi:hypothetical protein